MDFYNELLQNAMIDLQVKKIEVLKKMLKLAGIDFDFEAEKQRRFKCLLVEVREEDNSETYYYNDGSIEGLRIVTFIPDNDFQDNSTNLTYNPKYSFGFSYY
jgi:hypothetical protein